MLQTSDFFDKTPQPLRLVLGIAVVLAFASGCARRCEPPAAEQPAPVAQQKQVAPVPTLILMNKTYKAKNAVDIRSAPDPEADVVANLQANERFTAVAKVENGGWLLVGKSNRSIGFVHEALVQPSTGKKKSARKKTAAPPRDAVNLDGVEPAEKGVDLDALPDDREQ